MENGRQNPNLSFNDLYEQAKKSITVLDNLGKNVLADLQAQEPELFNNIKFEQAPIKAIERAQAKIYGDYGGNHSQISDIIRGRIVVHTPEQIKILQGYLKENAQTLGIEVIKDRFAKPTDTGFRDISMKIRLPNGHVAEFRVENSSIIQAAKSTHEPYEKIQDIERRAEIEKRMLTENEALERQKLLDNIRNMHGSAAQTANLDMLLNDEGNAKLKQFKDESIISDIGVASKSLEIHPSKLSQILEFTSKTLNVAGRAIPAVGGIIASAEVIRLSEQAKIALQNGEISTTDLTALSSIYSAHIIQGASDPTAFAGEIAVQKAYNVLTENWPAELQATLKPSSISDLFNHTSVVKPEQILFEQVIQGLDNASSQLSPQTQRLSDLYNNVRTAEVRYERAIQNTNSLSNHALLELELDEAYKSFETHYSTLSDNALNAVITELEGGKTQHAEEQKLAQQFQSMNKPAMSSDPIHTESETRIKKQIPFYDLNKT